MGQIHVWELGATISYTTIPIDKSFPPQQLTSLAIVDRLLISRKSISITFICSIVDGHLRLILFVSVASSPRITLRGSWLLIRRRIIVKGSWLVIRIGCPPLPLCLHQVCHSDGVQCNVGTLSKSCHQVLGWNTLDFLLEYDHIHIK